MAAYNWNQIGLRVLAIIVVAATFTVFAAPDGSQASTPNVTWTSRSPMPTGREGIFVAAIGDKIYAAGGGSGVCAFSNVLEEYDITTNSWQTLAAMPSARSNGGGAAAVAGKMYTMGGDDGCGGPVSVNNNEEYDPGTNTWTPKANMPVGRAHHDAIADGSRVLVFGGFDLAGVALSSVHAYDPAANTWDITLPNIPAPIGFARAAVIGNTAYVYDGSTGDLYAFNLVTNTWASPDPMSASVGQTRGLVVARGGVIYVIGGTVAGSIVDDVRVYDPAADSWTLLASTAPWFTGRHGLDGAAVSGKIYAIGGDLTLSPPYSQLNEEASITPKSVGGTAADSGLEALTLDTPAQSSNNTGMMLGVASAVAAGAVALGGAALYVRRRVVS